VKLAGAPISWGVCEVPDWGLQLTSDRVLKDMSTLGLRATEAGPPGFLPADPSVARALLDRHGLRLVGGFVTAVLHDPTVRAAALADVERQAAWLGSLGAAVLVLAAASGRTGYSAGDAIDDAGWTALFASLDEVAAIASRRHLTLAVHPHFGTVIERAEDIERFLSGCAHGLCLDTGHVALGGADPADVAERAGDRVRHVHLKDIYAGLAAKVRDGSVDYAPAVRRGLYRALGDGSARIGDVLDILETRGYAGWYVLEQDVMLDSAPTGIPEWIERSIAFTKVHA
jgi:inosose dehydratase